MKPIYSVRFCAVTGIDADTVASMTFPDGDYTFILRDMDAFTAGEGVSKISVHDSYGGTIWEVWTPITGTGIWEQWSGRQIYAPGDILYAEGNSDDPLGHMDWSASGYALTGVVPFAPQT